VTYGGTIRSLAGKTVGARQAGFAPDGTSRAKLARIAAEAATDAGSQNDSGVSDARSNQSVTMMTSLSRIFARR
jgi:hypothetical protein